MFDRRKGTDFDRPLPMSGEDVVTLPSSLSVTSSTGRPSLEVPSCGEASSSYYLPTVLHSNAIELREAATSATTANTVGGLLLLVPPSVSISCCNVRFPLVVTMYRYSIAAFETLGLMSYYLGVLFEVSMLQCSGAMREAIQTKSTWKGKDAQKAPGSACNKHRNFQWTCS